MIVVDEGGDHLCITQPDHARFAAELLGLWRGDGLPEHPRRRELLFAVREHDNGWREADAAPRCDPESGRPVDFRSCPSAERIEIWLRGTRRFAAERPWAAALVVRHALALHAPHRLLPGWREFFAATDALAAELMEAGGLDAAALEDDYRLLDLADRLSLAVCTRRRRPVRHALGSGRLLAGELRLDPFPLAGATRFEIPFRRIPARRYAGDADRGGELAAASWLRLTIRVAAAT